MKGRVVLFFTRGVSLKLWAMLGMRDRELAIYNRYAQAGYHVDVITYGDASDLEYDPHVPGIAFHCNHDNLPPLDYEADVVSIHEPTLAKADVIKTNQTNGAEIALLAAQRYGKPLIARCGYMWSFNTAREQGENSPAAQRARDIEASVFAQADLVFVTTDAMRRDVISRVPVAESRIHIIPNYVDTDLFRPMACERDSKLIVFVGRISPEKNLAAFLEAVGRTDARALIIGEGKLRAQLQNDFPYPDDKLTWEGNVANHLLPEYINRAAAFALPSLYEGHPKSLIEAMSCGVPVIAANSPGIREIVTHMENGYLCAPDAHGFGEAITDILSQPHTAARLAARGREFTLENFSLDAISRREILLVEKAISGRVGDQ